MFAIPAFIDACRAALRDADPANAVARTLAEVVPDPDAIERAVAAGEPADPDAAQYTFLHRSPELTVMNVVLPGGLESPPHDHLVWAAIGMYRGREASVFYRRAGGKLIESGRKELEAPAVMTLAPDAVHRIRNPDSGVSRALHVYGGSLANPARSIWNPATMEEERFDLSAMANYERDLTRAAGGRRHR